MVIMKGNQILSVLFLILYFQLTGAGFMFEIFLLNYRNPNHLSAANTVCDYGLGQGREVCDNVFTFCLRPFGGSRSTSSETPCSLGPRVTTMEFTNSDEISFSSMTSLGPSVLNPIVYSGHTWPGQFLLYVYIADSDYDNFDPVANIFVEKRLNPSPSYSPPETFTDSRGHAMLQLKFRVLCSSGFSGPNCTTMPTGEPPSDSLSTTRVPFTRHASTVGESAVTFTEVSTSGSASTTSAPSGGIGLGVAVGGTVGGIGIVLVVVSATVIIGALIIKKWNVKVKPDYQPSKPEIHSNPCYRGHKSNGEIQDEIYYEIPSPQS